MADREYMNRRRMPHDTLPAMSIQRRDPWTVRVAIFAAAHRWIVLAAWLFATIGVFVASLGLGGTDTQGAVNRDERARFEAAKAYDVFNASGPQRDPTQSVYLIVATDGSTIDDPAVNSAIDDAIARLGALRATVDGQSVAVFPEVVDPRMAPPEAGLVSPDRTAVRIVAEAPGEGEAIEARLAGVYPEIQAIQAAHPDLRIHGLSNTLANAQISEVVNGDVDGSLRLTIPLTFVILLIAFGSVVAALVPLVLAVTALLAAFGFLGVYSQLVAEVSPYAGQLIVLIGLAVAIDYSLFMISPFRTELRRGRPVPAAIRIASATAGRAVFFSGLAVMISIAGLFLLDDPLFRSMAIGTIAVVFISVLGSLTFLPAVLAVLGRRVNSLRIPFLGRAREEGGGLWATVVARVMGRPVIFFVVAAGFLAALSTPVARLHLGQTDLTSFPDSIDSVQAIKVMNERWPAGSTLRLQVVVTRADDPATTGLIEELTRRTLAVPGISGPVDRQLSIDGTVALVSYTMSGGQNDAANRQTVIRMRSEVVPAVFAGSAPEAFVTGDAAWTYDTTKFYEDGMPLVLAFVLGLSFVLLLIAFRSIVIPIKAIILNLLSTGAAYGVLVLVFQEGWLGDALGVEPGVIEAFVPVFIFTILFGLSMDYHVFILTRIKEARDRGAGSNEAVGRGIAITAGTITSAAAIMVVVFAVFVTLRLVIIRQLGLGLAVAIFIDATIVRSILLPASMRLLGEWNWWLPRWLGWLPRVTIEAEDDAVDEDTGETVVEPGRTAPSSA